MFLEHFKKQKKTKKKTRKALTSSISVGEERSRTKERIPKNSDEAK